MRTIPLFGLQFVTETSVDEIATLLLAEGAERDRAPAEWRTVVTPNVDHLVHYRHHEEDLRLTQYAHLVLPDGAPIVWASRVLGAPLSGRLAGSDLFAAWWPQLCQLSRPVVILASNQELADELQRQHADVRCIVSPFFELHDAAAVEVIVKQLLDAVHTVRPDAVVIGLPMAKSHALARGMRECEPPEGTAPLLLMLGASAEFYVGLQQRAPMWMQRYGLEWLHRLLSDPRRLAKRYLVDDMAFLPLVWREWRMRRSLATEVSE